MPNDLRAVIFTDPNCALKEKGDTTAITCLAWSSMMQKYYITSARCKSYSSSDTLITDFLTLRSAENIREVAVIAQAFDGNVSQESTWTNSLLNYSKLHDMPLPFIAFKKYKVDDLATIAEQEWKAGKFLFPPGFRKTVEGKEYTDQVFKFKLKKAAKKDDAPDSLISALELMQEFHINVIGGRKPIFTSVSKKTFTRAL